MNDKSALEEQNAFVILVVDDDQMNRMLAEAVLESAGYTVRLAASGQGALESFLEKVPDLVLLDVMMPKMNGYETCRKLRELPGGADIPILFLTAHADLSAHQKALESGGDDFLTKPLNRTELLIRAKSLVRIRRMQRELTSNYELIREQRDALVRADRQKQELMDLIVHDLKSPLAGILTNVEFALSTGNMAQEAWDALHDVVGGAQTMLRMVLNLLDISRSEDGLLTPTFDEVDLTALAQEVRVATQRRAEQEKRSLVVQHASPAIVRAEKDLLRRLLENLVDNSLKYTPRGTTVTIEIERRGPNVRLLVKDQGRGVPASERQRIFQKYAQIERGSHGDDAVVRSSRGLGLAFCMLATKALGGLIWVEDNEPNGSVFVVEFPG
jgi:two-component system sensor histidine kinase/response regulator